MEDSIPRGLAGIGTAGRPGEFGVEAELNAWWQTTGPSRPPGLPIDGRRSACRAT